MPTVKVSDEAKMAEKAFSTISDSLIDTWTNTDFYYLSEPITRPWPEEKLNSIPFIEDRVVDPMNTQFPFREIAESLVKIMADPEFVNVYKRTYHFKNLLDNEPDVTLKNFKNAITGDICREDVNLSAKRSKLFLETLTELANTFSFTTYAKMDHTRTIKRTRFFLLGDPGTGKTTFINYLLSVHTEDILVPKKTMLIRIDLNRWIKRKNPNFKELIIEKFYGVYYKYFFKDKKHADWVVDIDNLREYIKKKRNIKDTEIAYIKCLEKDIKNFREGLVDPTNPFKHDLMLYLQEQHGISYIFAFDGLDYVTLGEVSSDLFTKYLDEIDDYILGPKAFDGVYLLVMRKGSYNKALEDKRESSNDWSDLKIVNVKTSKFGDVFESKLNEAKRNILQKLTSWRQIAGPNYYEYAWLNGDIVTNIIREFKFFLSWPFLSVMEQEEIRQLSSPIDICERATRKGLTVLHKISCGNYRCLMRSLFIIVGHFARCLGSKPEKAMTWNFKERMKIYNSRQYLVVRSLIVGRIERQDYFTPYSYDYIKSKKELIFVKKGTRFSIPSINTFAYSDKIVKCRPQFRGLIKIRVLQLLEKAETGIGKTSLSDSLVDCLGYNRKYIEYDLKEMLYNQLIHVGDVDHFMDGGDSIITISELGRFVLNTLIYWYIYWEVILDALPMPKALADAITPANIYWETNTDIDFYVILKSKNVLLYLKYLEYCEKREFVMMEALAKEKANCKTAKLYDGPIKMVIPSILKAVKSDLINNFANRIGKNEKLFFTYVERISKRGK